MRKRIASAVSSRSALDVEHWIDLEGLAEIEMTSEDPAHPIEGALLPGHGDGWRASERGPQMIRIVFDNPQDIALVHLVFAEEHSARTQEFSLHWSPARDEPLREILRQQYNFTPISSEVEDYRVNLRAARILEIHIDPSIGQHSHFASLTELRFR